MYKNSAATIKFVQVKGSDGSKELAFLNLIIERHGMLEVKGNSILVSYKLPPL